MSNIPSSLSLNRGRCVSSISRADQFHRVQEGTGSPGTQLDHSCKAFGSKVAAVVGRVPGTVIW
ncbi:unnamed protein product [Leuciscus chuanchicus]